MTNPTFFDLFKTHWAQDGSVDGFSLPQYKTGWSFIGSTPPSVEEFNAWGQLLDQKANWLYGQLKTAADSGGVALGADDLGSLQQVLAKGGSGRLLRTLVYTRVGGAQMVSIDGGTPTPVGASNFIPLDGTATAEIEVLGGGGAGGGAPVTNAVQVGVGAGGNAGGYAVGRFTAAQIGAALAIAVGAGGASVAGGRGDPGAASSAGGLIRAEGGAGGGALGPSGADLTTGNGHAGALTSGGNIVAMRGGVATIAFISAFGIGWGGQGANSFYGAGAGSVNGTSAGADATGSGAGGSGAYAGRNNPTARAGGVGSPGIVIIRERA